MYALRNLKTGKLLGVYADSNPEDGDCPDVEYIICEHQDNVWVVNDMEVAQKAATNSNKWYSSSYEAPTNRFAGMCEVVQLTVSIVVR